MSPITRVTSIGRLLPATMSRLPTSRPPRAVISGTSASSSIGRGPRGRGWSAEPTTSSSNADQAPNRPRTLLRLSRASTVRCRPLLMPSIWARAPTGQQVGSVIREIMTLLDALEAHYGRRPVIYTGSEFDAAYLQGQLTGDRF